MSIFLLVDFGASRVKYAAFDAVSVKFRNEGDLPVPRPLRADGGFYEESPELLKETFFRACKKAASGLSGLSGVMLSSQMHGFVVLNAKGEPLTPYISWKDERSRLSLPGRESAFGVLEKRLGRDYRRITGMDMRSCFPAFNFAALARKRKLPRKCRIASLPEWLCAACGNDAGLVHESVFAGLGFYDLAKRRVSPDVYDAVSDYCGRKPSFGCPVSESVPAATLRLGREEVPVYAGVGDHQCAVLGAGNISGKTLSVNVGTGSQVSSPGLDLGRAEVRPYFEGGVMGTVTHIPAGRALEVFLGLFGSTASAELWKRLGRLKPGQALSCGLNADLAVFPSARGYKGGGALTGIGETFSRDEYLCALVRGMAVNYAAAEQLLSGGKLRRAVFGGGLARKIPALAGAFEMLTGVKTSVYSGGEETLRGLALLALKACGAAPDLEAASKLLRVKGDGK